MDNSFGFNKELIGYCKNYYTINNMDYDIEDKVTEKLLVIYKEFIFSITVLSQEIIKKLQNIDSVVYKYMTDHKFKKVLGNELVNMKVKSKVENVLDYVVSTIIDVYEDYVLNYTRQIFLPRWI